MKKILSVLVFSGLAFSTSAFAEEAATKSATPITAAAAAKPAANNQQEAININTADAQTLTKLKGIGPKKAEAVIAWRKANGNFKTVDQLADVKGIGAKTVEVNRKNIRL